MKKNGFTLIELLAVVIILAAIALIALPSVTKSVQESKETAYQTQIETITKATNDYILQNLVKGVKFSNFLKNDGDTTDIFLYDLKRQGLVEKDIKNPKTGNLLSDNMIIKITKKNGNYEIRIGEYKDYGTNSKVFEEGLIDDLESSNTQIDSSAPIISLNGSAVKYYEVDASCTEDCEITTDDIKGFVTVSGADNDDLTFSITSGISKKEVKSYNVVYNVTDDESGKSAKALTIMIIIRDTQKPTIDVPSTTTLSSSTISSGYNLLTDVTFNDNSIDGNINCDTDGNCDNGFQLKISGSLTPPIPGSYTVTYELTDASGNTRTKTRNFVVVE